MKYFIAILFVVLLFLTGCSKNISLNNVKTCQEGCLGAGMSYNGGFTSFEKNASIDVLKCGCDFYIEVPHD